MGSSTRASIATEQLVRQLNERENVRDLDGISALLTDDHVGEVNGVVEQRSREDTREADEMVFTMFPDYHREMTSFEAVGPWLVTRWEIIATHGGHLPGLAPTGRSVSFGGVTVWRARDGLLSWSSMWMPRASVYRQLGVEMDDGFADLRALERDALSRSTTWEESYNAEDVDGFLTMLSEDVTVEEPPQLGSGFGGRESYRQAMQELLQQYPGRRMRYHRRVPAGAMVAMEGTFTATAGDQVIEAGAAVLLTFRDGLVSRERVSLLTDDAWI